jgi:pimeloyl-ACP methyl ester carboxylesterase
VNPEVAKAIGRHEGSGRRFSAEGIGSFALEVGSGDPVVLMHGVPVSSYLYRRVAPELAARGLRAVSFDLPGLGLAGRPPDFDYSWSGLGRWTGAAIDALGIERCHLVVHDIGGPIGLDWAARNPERVLSLTALDTMIDVAAFHRPWPMHPFSLRGVGEVWLRSMMRVPFRQIYYLVGIGDRTAVPPVEVDVHHALLKRADGGRAFLQIMRGFELTVERERFLLDRLAKRPYPAQVVWGSGDRMLGEDRRLAAIRALGVEAATMVPAKHFLQEDRPVAVAEAIAHLVP